MAILSRIARVARMPTVRTATPTGSKITSLGARKAVFKSKKNFTPVRRAYP